VVKEVPLAAKNNDGNGAELRQHAKSASQLLRAVGNQTRLMILCALVDDEHSVGELNSLVGLSMSALSQHLSVLRREGYVQTRREAQTIFYSLQNREVRSLMQCLHRMYCR
jgi:DNA-binding transcriptional ArsR family regulator